MTIAHRRDFAETLVHAAARLRDALDAMNVRRALRVVLQDDIERLLDLLAFLFDPRYSQPLSVFQRSTS